MLYGALIGTHRDCCNPDSSQSRGDYNRLLGIGMPNGTTKWIDTAGYVGSVFNPVDMTTVPQPQVQRNEWGACMITDDNAAHPAWLPGLGLLALALARASWLRKGRALAAGFFAVAATAASLAGRPAEAQAPLVGDCNGDGRVTVNEVVTIVNVDLGVAPASACDACPDHLPPVILSCAVEAINNLLFAPTPTPAE